MRTCAIWEALARCSSPGPPGGFLEAADRRSPEDPPPVALANALALIERLEGSLAICERAHRRPETAAVTEPEQELCHEPVPQDNEMSRKPFADLPAWSPAREGAIDPVLAAPRVKPW